MIQLITSSHHDDFADDLAEMHRLRFRVFKGRLDWDVQVRGDKEMDQFDALDSAYLLYRDCESLIRGCVRLLPSTGPTMLRSTFASLLLNQSPPESPEVWESSRFAVDLPSKAPKGAGGIGKATYELFAGMVAFGLLKGLTEIVTVTDARMERILRRAAWPLRTLGAPKLIGSTRAVAGYLEVSHEALARLCKVGDLKGPVLWEPVRIHAD